MNDEYDKLTLTPKSIDGIHRYSAKDFEALDPPKLEDVILRDMWLKRRREALKSLALGEYAEEEPTGIMGDPS